MKHFWTKSAAGAALLAAVGAGQWGSVEEACAEVIQVTGRATPRANVARYEELYQIYRDLYSRLKPVFAQLSDLDK